MKLRNWRKRFGTPLTTDREPRTLSDDALRDQRDAYEEWLRAAGHVRPTDVDFAAVRRSRGWALNSARLSLEYASEKAARFAGEPDEYWSMSRATWLKRRKEANYALSDAQRDYRVARRELDNLVSIREDAIDNAISRRLYARLDGSAVVVSLDGAAPQAFATDRDFRRAWKQMELPA